MGEVMKTTNSIKVMSYNVDTPEKDWSDWVSWRKSSVVDVMTQFNLEDFYGLQETKNGGGSQVCDQILEEINVRDAVKTAGKNYAYISIKDQDQNPNHDCENSIFYDASHWTCLSYEGKFIYQDWDPRYAFYGIFQAKSNPLQKVVVFNTHAPAGNYPGSHNGFLPQDFQVIAAYVESARKLANSEHPEMVPTVFTGDWNGNVQGQADLKNIGLETCRIKAGQRGDTGPTWPSSNPSEGFDQILAGQQGMDWANSSVSVLGRGNASVEKASDHLPIEAGLCFVAVNEAEKLNKREMETA